MEEKGWVYYMNRKITIRINRKIIHQMYEELGVEYPILTANLEAQVNKPPKIYEVEFQCMDWETKPNG